MWFGGHGDLGMWRWLRDSAGFSNPKGLTQFQQVASQVETSGVVFRASGKILMLVFEPRPLRSDTWKPKQGFRLGPRFLSGSIFWVCGHLSACLRGGSCSASVRMPLFFQGG